MEVKPVDFREVARRIQSVISTTQKHDSEERFCKLGVKVEFREPYFADEHAIRLNGETHTAKNWVIATGSSPSIPPIEGLDRTPHITNKGIFSLDRLPKTMIILGAGPIAIEMAQAFCRLGTRVSVVQRSNQILSKEDKDMADQVMNVLLAEEVTFYLSSSVVRTKDLENEREVMIRTGEGKTVSLGSEIILVAMGREANLRGLGLDDIGVAYDRKGLEFFFHLRGRACGQEMT